MRVDRAKGAIETFYKGDPFKYLPIWKIIDSSWDRQLHSPLHAVGVYLNLSIFYNEGSNIQDFFCNSPLVEKLVLHLLQPSNAHKTIPGKGSGSNFIR
jgi:hypothetical protein